MNLRHKILVGFCLSMILVVSIEIYTLTFLDSTNQSIEDIVEQKFVSDIYIRDLNDIINDIHMGIWDAMFLGNITKEGMIKRLAEDSAEVADLINLLIERNPQKKEDLKNLSRNYQYYAHYGSSILRFNNRNEFYKNIEVANRFIDVKTRLTKSLNTVIEALETEFSTSLFSLKDFFQRTSFVIILCTILAVMVGIVFSFIFSGTLTKPIHSLVEIMSQVEKNNYNVTAKPSSKDEIGKLTITFNSMIKQIRLKRDDLEQKVTERTINLEKANKKLKQLDSLKNDFIANITHDFRSPLTSILNISDIALHYGHKLDEENKDNYEIINRSAVRLKNSIDRLLELAKLDAQGIKLKVKKTDPVSLLRRIIEFYTSSVTGSGINIIGNLPDGQIDNFYTDPEKLEEILDNVISNSIKFIDPKSGIISINLSEDSNSVLITISDNGIGIPKDKLTVIFDRFEQAHEGRNSGYKGTGIGLAFSKQLVEYLKGKIWAESKGKGKGAAFFIELKKSKDIFDKKYFSDETAMGIDRESIKKIIKKDIEARLREVNYRTYFADLNKENEFNYKKSKILIIDDDSEIQSIIMRYLKNHDFMNFIVASNGKHGLEAFEKHSPDLIICDLNMPGMRGDELHNRLMGNPRFKEIPFIFLSAIVDEDLMIERKQKGASAYLIKPIDEKELIVTVEEFIINYFKLLRIRKKSEIDEISGLYNRKSVITCLNHELAKAKYADMALILFDMDYFRDINETRGNGFGDMVLAKTGELIKSFMRTSDIAGRYGGDEFIVILPDTNLKQAVKLAKKLLEQIQNIRITQTENNPEISASFGVVSLKECAKYIERALGVDNLDEIYASRGDRGKELAELLLRTAGRTLQDAKRTTCPKCGLSSQERKIFINNKCPSCNYGELTFGRNKVHFFNE